jgi:hypothetical protein
MAAPALPPVSEGAKELVQLCRAGRLYELEKWIAAGRPLDVLLHRYATVGARLDRLYKIVFASTYWSDLIELGFENVAKLLQLVQKRRNEFAHGQPAAIDERLITSLVAALKDEHEAWIAVFNKRAAKRLAPRSS